MDQERCGPAPFLILSFYHREFWDCVAGVAAIWTSRGSDYCVGSFPREFLSVCASGANQIKCAIKQLQKSQQVGAAAAEVSGVRSARGLRARLMTPGCKVRPHNKLERRGPWIP
jgi:hypothetical protein